MKGEYIYNDYNKNPDPSHRPMYLSKVLAFLGGDQVRKVIDVGCGGGDFSVGLAEAGYEVYGIDLSESAIRFAKSRGIGNFAVSSVYTDLTKPFESVNQFDAAVLVDVIEHLYSPRLCIHQISKSLRPGGLLIITTPYWGYLKNLLLALTNRTDAALTVLWDGGHIKHFSRKTLVQLVTERDFKFVGFKGCGEGLRARAPYLWNGMLVCFRKT